MTEQRRKKVYVILGGSFLAGASFWGSAMYNRVGEIETKIPAIEAIHQSQVDTEKRLDRIETKLDRLIERR